MEFAAADGLRRQGWTATGVLGFNKDNLLFLYCLLHHFFVHEVFTYSRLLGLFDTTKATIK